MNKVRIRVTRSADGRVFLRELMHGEEVVCELSPVEIIEFIMQASSSLRYDVPHVRE